ncbi:MAG: glycoside hydrolase family 172 protein [Armatimonadota bacterium]
MYTGSSFGMSHVPFLADAKTRSISAENPEGKKGGGAQADPDAPDSAQGAKMLGKGWKVRPCITLPAEETTEIADISGSGVISHIWITVKEQAYRNCILRIYWDGEDSPSVEVPLGDFFCCGHSKRTKVNSMPICVNPSGGFNSYWPMPFRDGARITVQNQWHEDISGFFYQVTYQQMEVPDDAAYLHAQWRRSMGSRQQPEHVILDGIEGRGQYVGTYLAWTQFSDGWWGEGEVKFYIDGDSEYPTICGTGTEDYFGGAWCFGDTFSTPFLGYPLWERQEETVPKHGLYRWHIMDPIRFDEDLRVTVQELGWWPNRAYEPLTDDIASVGYWYQMEPHAAFPDLPPVHLRWSR